MKLYEAVLSTKDRIIIDESDLEKIKSNLGGGNLIAVKKGIINPSFLVAIVPREKVETREQITNGYVDENTGVFVATGVREGVPKLADEFAKKTTQIANRLKPQSN